MTFVCFPRLWRRARLKKKKKKKKGTQNLAGQRVYVCALIACVVMTTAQWTSSTLSLICHHKNAYFNMPPQERLLYDVI